MRLARVPSAPLTASEARNSPEMRKSRMAARTTVAICSAEKRLESYSPEPLRMVKLVLAMPKPSR